MGEVFRAVAVGHAGFEKPVIVKRVLPELVASESARRLFLEEARLMTRLAHPNIVQVLDLGEGERGDAFLVLELVDGVDLGRLLAEYSERGERVPLGAALFIAAQLCRGLAFAHEQTDVPGLVHRDVSPGNVLLSRAGEVKVADFGVARAGSSSDGPGVVGKPAYMAPEQVRGEAVDARADVFSAGVVIFELLTGQKPFSPRSLAERVHADDEPPRRARDLVPDLPAAVDEAVSRALTLDVARRTASARELGRALAATREHGVVLADQDDLAALVTSVRRAAGRAVVVLGAGEASALGAGRELATARIGDVTRFTVRLEGDAPHEPPQLPAPEPLPAPAPRRVAGWLALPALLALGGLAWMLTRDAPVSPAKAARSPTAEAPASPQATGSVALLPPVPPASAAASAAPAPWREDARAPQGAAASVGSPGAAPGPRRCTGSVVFLSHGSWSVRGGPTSAETPGRYTWPCGGYSLSATSRADPAATRARAVTVREGATVSVDLR